MNPRPNGPPCQRDECGFTLIEVLVVILVVGILAAIALPSLLGQTRKSHDASAKSDVSALAQTIEQCRTQQDSYRSCDEKSELEAGPTLKWGTAEGRAGIASATKDGYYAYAVSMSKTDRKNHVFARERSASGMTNWFCLKNPNQPVVPGSCRDSRW